MGRLLIPRDNPSRLKQGGFTLVELLSVMVIIAILMGMILGIGNYAKRRARVGRAKGDIQTIHNALLENRLKYGILPADISALTGATSTVREWLPQGFTFEDPWSTPDKIQYYQYTKNSAYTYSLYSMGPDKTNNTPDDIKE